MALYTESLVLRGVSVLRDGQVVGLRLGSYEAGLQTSAVPFSMRHPSLGCRTSPTTTAWHPNLTDNPVKEEAILGAGRSLCRAGVLTVSRCAEGGPQLTAARRLGLMAKPPASVVDASASRRASDRKPRAFTDARAIAPRTPFAASTRGG
jgi:hypothetical protein